MTYEKIRRHPPDFEVTYRFLTAAEGGRQTGPPGQHYRCDWAYDGDDIQKDGIFMIHPEFLTPEGDIFPEFEIAGKVSNSGRATMWILVPEMRRTVHQRRLSVGTRGYFMEGSRKVAEAAVTRIIALHANPIG